LEQRDVNYWSSCSYRVVAAFWKISGWGRQRLAFQKNGFETALAH